jgi:hypothetical protein
MLIKDNLYVKQLREIEKVISENKVFNRQTLRDKQFNLSFNVFPYDSTKDVLGTSLVLS